MAQQSAFNLQKWQIGRGTKKDARRNWFRFQYQQEGTMEFAVQEAAGVFWKTWSL
jgi:hypothetical protein